MDKQQFLDTWEINNQVNLYLLDAIQEDYLTDTLASKGRNVGEQFAHLHQVRMMWLKAASPDLFSKLNKIEKGMLTKNIISEELTNSSRAISSLLHIGFEQGKIKGFKPHPMGFLGYLIAHESHHRGQIILCLKQSGHPLDKKILYGIWEWGSLHPHT
jgi:uncharacterized damage-inducible protein DinB